MYKLLVWVIKYSVRFYCCCIELFWFIVFSTSFKNYTSILKVSINRVDYDHNMGLNNINLNERRKKAREQLKGMPLSLAHSVHPRYSAKPLCLHIQWMWVCVFNVHKLFRLISTSFFELYDLNRKHFVIMFRVPASSKCEQDNEDVYGTMWRCITINNNAKI